MKLAWVIGRGGLLGSGLERALSRTPKFRIFRPTADRWNWSNAGDVREHLTNNVTAFAAALGAHDAWQIHWAAGRGTMASTPEELAAETAMIAHLLEAISREPALQSTTGSILFASSAGAIYGHSGGNAITEMTTPEPATDYGREKLAQERLITEWTGAHPNMTALLARFSNIYGPGQSPKKNQGLITHIARSILRHAPVNIFVPFDTIRDYIYVDDAAERAIALLERSRGTTVAIIASEETTTIAHIVGAFRRLTRLNPRIVRSTNALGSAYPRLIRFRSSLRNEREEHRTPLHVGIARTMAHEHDAFTHAA